MVDADLTELVNRGGNEAKLRALAHTDRASLAVALKELGYAKMGHRMAVEKALLAPPAASPPEPASAAPAAPPEPLPSGPPPSAAADDPLAELSARGADIAKLRALALTDRAGLAARLKELGYTKMGQRMALEKALLDPIAPVPELVCEPCASDPSGPSAPSSYGLLFRRFQIPHRLVGCVWA